MSDAHRLLVAPGKKEKPWIPNQPEQRLSIALNRLLDDILIRPCYFVANKDADDGGRNDNQRMRDINRGINYGQLDWEVEQGPPHIMRRIELKIGKNETTDKQDDTIKKCTACGAPPIVAWTLREAIDGLIGVGFRFTANVEIRLQYWQLQLEGWNREAEGKLAGTIKPKKSKTRKPNPRHTAGKGFRKRAAARGILL